ncbi:MAG: low-specificity L-threonine aldolase [Calditrichaeota bacterium]|nr:low-specificity L-threonine aldolase [Calditrichota bacterium]
MRHVDLRSDTVTRPTPEMRQAMLQAEVGDDVFGEDPTVNQLQEMVAAMLGKEAALFVPSGTMGNQISINAHTRPGEEIIVERDSHIVNYECGASAMLAGVQLHIIDGQDGIMTMEQVAAAVRPRDVHQPQTRLVCLENTHNRAGGTIYPLEEIARISQFARERGLKLHLDGARLWNASVATGISLKNYAQYFDSVMLCFSKGLGAPVGSIVVGDREFIERAHYYRKAYGGGMRQVGILAAAAIHALEHHLERLADDHRRARKFAEAISHLPGIRIDLERVQTNIVMFDVDPQVMTADQLIDALRQKGVFMLNLGPRKIRAVTHLDVSDADIDYAIEAFRELLGH